MIKDFFFIKHISKAIELKLILSRISTSAYETYETWRRKKEYSYESSITYPRIFPRYYYYNTRFPRLEDSLAIFSYAERKKYKSLMQIVSAINAWPGNLLFLLKIRGDSEGFAGSVSDTKERNRDFAWVSLNKPWDNRPKPFLSLLFPSYLSSQSSPLSLSFSFSFSSSVQAFSSLTRISHGVLDFVSCLREILGWNVDYSNDTNCRESCRFILQIRRGAETILKLLNFKTSKFPWNRFIIKINI